MSKRVVIYVRVSTDEQAKHGYSIKAQIEKLEAFCESQGYELVKIYIDEGESAKDLNRTQYKIMMQDIKNGGIDILLVYKLDRLTRSVLDLYKILNELEQYNCSFKSATEIYDTTSAIGKLFITLVAAIAQWERENLAERVRMGKSKKVREGKFGGGKSAYGYYYTNDQLTINEEEAKIVRLIFDMAFKIGFTGITKELINRGIPKGNNAKWHKDTIKQIVNNPIYIGYNTFSESLKEYKLPPAEKELFKGDHDPIIDEKLFWMLQEELDKRRREGTKRTTSDYYFSSVLHCARCGSSMNGQKMKGNKYYRCNAKRAGQACDSHMVKEDNIVKAIFNYIEDMDELSLEGKVDSKITKDETQEIQQELARINKVKEKKRHMYELEMMGYEQFALESSELVKREKELLRKLSMQQRPEDEQAITDIKKNLKPIWEKATEQERKEIIKTLIEKVYIDTEDNGYYVGSKIPRNIVISSLTKTLLAM